MNLIAVFIRLFVFCIFITCFSVLLFLTDHSNVIITEEHNVDDDVGKFNIGALVSNAESHNLIKNDAKFREISSEKWIVITTIGQVSDDIKFMAEFTDWRIVIVGDRKTPKTWKYKNCVYLSVEDQQKLNYHVLSLIPYNSYTRKIVGYLYAIENGAKFIYDTDDDNRPIKSKLEAFQYGNITNGFKVSGSRDSFRLVNAYAHFGRADIWPRGLPLQLINDPNSKDYGTELCDEIRTPVVQQGLVNRDPDVDAIIRMIFVKNKTQGLDVTFDPAAPPLILPPAVYGPFNSQNTLFHYRAFWALLLPIGVTARVTDIWRGYWAQRLMHLTGDRLAYYGANARQHRNPHRFFDDFLDESQVYTQTLDLVRTIQNWTCASKSFSNCIVEMTRLMARKSFVPDAQVQLAEMWIKDLINVGYQFPQLKQPDSGSEKNSCRNSAFVSSTDKNVQPESVQMNGLKILNDFCRPFVLNELKYSGFSRASFQHTKNVVLIVTFNHAHFGHIPLLQTLYEPWYANVIYCATFPANLHNLTLSPTPNNRLFENRRRRFSFVNLTDDEMLNGFFGYTCLSHVADMQIPEADGYLVISDDALLNFWTPYDLTRVHLHNACAKVDFRGNGFQWWNSSYGESALLELQAELLSGTIPSDKLSADTLSLLKEILMMPIWCASDVYYVPHKMLPTYSELSKLFSKHQVFLEIAVPKILAVLGWTNSYKRIMKVGHAADKESVDLNGKYLWTLKERGNPFNVYDPKDVFMHPIKMSLFDQSAWRNGFCNSYIPALFNAVSKRGQN